MSRIFLNKTGFIPSFTIHYTARNRVKGSKNISLKKLYFLPTLDTAMLHSQTKRGGEKWMPEGNKTQEDKKMTAVTKTNEGWIAEANLPSGKTRFVAKSKDELREQIIESIVLHKIAHAINKKNYHEKCIKELLSLKKEIDESPIS